jgi:formylglycine-generating enzyme required for sulfatase activity
MGDHVFICYARQDQDFVLKLAANLKERGARVWLDQWDISPSADWDLTIDNALYDCAQFLIVLSPAAVASGEVRGELRTALDENKPIVPVLYRKCRIPRRLKLIQHVDFTARGPDDGAALGQVLSALGVSEPSRPTPKVRRREEAAPTRQPFELVKYPIVSRHLPREEAAPARQPFEPEMVLIPAGQFLMGSDPSVDKDARGNEQPQHTLHLPDYYLAKTPLTNAQYAAFVQATGHKQPQHWKALFRKGGNPPRGKEDHPVVYVSWHDAVAYCRWLAEVIGRPYGLPSEAEWEKGARGSDGRIWPWGNRWDAKRCNTWKGGKKDTAPVGAYPQGASPYGLLDMAGNVWEWTCSLWGEDPKEPSFRYPYHPADGRESLEAPDRVLRVLRGGSWHSSEVQARCVVRVRDSPGSSYSNRGFRLVSPVGSGY